MNLDDILWALAEWEWKGQPVWLRFRQFPESFRRGAYPERVNIFWEMSESESHDYPTESEHARLGDFEEHLCNAVEWDLQSVLCVIITRGGKREFVFQTTDPQEFLRRLTAMPQRRDRYPISIHHFSDPNWAYFDEVVPTT